VLNGSRASLAHGNDGGTVVRLGLSLPYPGQGIPRVVSNTVIASGFEERTDPAALALGPTGLGLGRDGTLYVADTLENRIAAIPDALTRQDSAYTGRDLTAGGGLNGPLGLTILPNGDILTANGNDGKMVHITPDGTQAKAVLVDGTPSQGNPPGAGALFGLAVSLGGHQIYFGDDATNTLNRVAIAETM
jgi:sugar lactone lactonase YvrE